MKRFPATSRAAPRVLSGAGDHRDRSSRPGVKRKKPATQGLSGTGAQQLAAARSSSDSAEAVGMPTEAV